MTFLRMLETQALAGKHVCVGLDPTVEGLPEDLLGYARVRNDSESIAGCLGEAMVRVIKATHHIAAAFKPNTAPYERYGSHGWSALERVMRHARETGVPVILDAKRGDIGATNEHYAAMAFDHLGADAITIHPYLGWEANKPFLDRKDKGIFVLCRTSNIGAGEFQDYEVVVPPSGLPLYIEQPEGDMRKSEGVDRGIQIPLYQRVASHVSDFERWNYNGNCGLVMGATYPEELSKVRRFAPDIPFLMPGFGKQGANLKTSLKAAGDGPYVANSSSGICHADDPGAAAEAFHEDIQSIHIKLS